MGRKESTKGAIVIGWINKGKAADCGETMKNQLLVQRLEELGVRCRQIDVKGWRKHPWIFIQLAWDMIVHHNDTIIFSSSAANTYPMMKLMYRFGWKQKTVHWVIGGLFGERVQKGYFDRKVVGIIDHTLVESPLMKIQLESCGLKNVKVVPNFKPINYYPSIDWKSKEDRNRPLRFVFLSRIIPEKGCDYILEAAQILNEKEYFQKFSVDFYGKIDEAYKDTFFSKVNQLENVRYSGFLNLRNLEGYDILSQYDAMLFPTYWMGEGFAGIFIDAMISGLPIIATDWMHNKYLLKDGETAMFIPAHDAKALAIKMQECIDCRVDLAAMACHCQQTAQSYDTKKVITRELLKEINII